MKRKSLLVTFILVLLFSVVSSSITQPIAQAATAQTYNATGVVTTQKDPLTLRQTNSASSTALASILKGTKITIGRFC